MRYPVQKPDYRNNGMFQFVVGHTGGGAEECQHVTREQVCERLAAMLGSGTLEDDGENLWWVTDGPQEPWIGFEI